MIKEGCSTEFKKVYKGVLKSLGGESKENKEKAAKIAHSQTDENKTESLWDIVKK